MACFNVHYYTNIGHSDLLFMKMRKLPIEDIHIQLK